MRSKPKLYLESSVICMYFQDSAPYLRDVTRQFWKNKLPYSNTYISDIVLDEIRETKKEVNTKLMIPVPAIVTPEDFLRRVCKMPKTEVTDIMKKEIQKKVKREFPGCKSLQDLHYYRYIKDIERQNMSIKEIVEDIKDGADEIKREINANKEKTYALDRH